MVKTKLGKIGLKNNVENFESDQDITVQKQWNFKYLVYDGLAFLHVDRTTGGELPNQFSIY